MGSGNRGGLVGLGSIDWEQLLEEIYGRLGRDEGLGCAAIWRFAMTCQVAKLHSYTASQSLLYVLGGSKEGRCWCLDKTGMDGKCLGPKIRGHVY